MMKKGLNTLQQLIKDKTEEFISELFSSYVVVTEKIDAARVTFQVKDDTITIWRKDERYPISVIDRTLMQYYEKAIDHITSVIDYAVIPEDYKFGCYYFSSLTPNKTQYKRMPKNNIVLTDVRITDENGEKIKDSGETLRKWATELRIEPAPIIFEGYLTDKQKVKILEYINLTPKELHERYGGKTFSEFLIKVLNPNVNSSFLQDEGVYRPDSIIFRFKTKQGDTYVAKTIDPLVASNADMNEEIPESTVPSDLYSIALMDMCSFIIENGLPYKLKERTPEFRYLELVCLLFNDFMKENMDRYKGVDFSEPSFLKIKEFELNRRFIDNEKTLEIMNLDRSYEQLFKIMLAGLRKKRRRTYGLLTHALINQINLIIDEVREIVDVPLVEGLMDFSTFRIFRDEDANKFVDLDSIKNIEYDDGPMKKTCTMVVAKPAIITKELERSMSNLSEYDNVFFACMKNEQSPISQDVVKAQLEAFKPNNGSISCFYCEDEESLKKKIEEIAEEFDIETFCCPSELTEWLSSCIGQEVGNMGHMNDETKAMEYISCDDFSRFKSVCPDYISSMYMGIQNDLEKTQKIEYRI